MARLQDIEIRESTVTYSNQRGWFFHPTGHHVRALLLHFLPPNFTLDGSSKFSVIFGEKPSHDRPYDQMLGCSHYYVEDVDIPEYMARPRGEQQEIILTELTKAMQEVARAIGADVTPISVAATAVRTNGFQCEIKVSKLCRMSKDRQFQVDVVRRLDPDIGEAWEAVISRARGSVLAVEPINAPGCLDRRSHYSKSLWNGDIFQIVSSRLDDVQFELDLAKYR